MEQNGACLPWTWFMAVYVQLSVALPFCIYLYFRYPKFAMIGHVVLIIGSLLRKYLIVTSLFNDLQALGISTAGLANPARNIVYFTKQYTSPLEHYLTFMVFGAQSGYIFYFYIQRMVDSRADQVKLGDKIYNILTKWKKSMYLRVLSFILAIIIILESWALRYYSSVNQWSRFPLVLYALFQDTLTNIGLMCLIAPMLLSKYKPLSYVLTMKGFSIISHILMPLMVLLPIMFVRYYYELHQMLTIDYSQMIFYTIGTYVFTMPLAYFAFLLFQAPIISFLRIFKECEMVRTGEK